MGEVTVDDLEKLASGSAVRKFHFNNMIWEATPPSYQDWVKGLVDALEYCSDRMAESKASYQQFSELQLMESIHTNLALIGFDAELRLNGTLVVTLQEYEWVGSGITDSVHPSQYFSTLISDYVQGKKNKSCAGILIFCLEKNASEAQERWRSQITTSPICHSVVSSDAALSFVTDCISPATGYKLSALHLFIPLRTSGESRKALNRGSSSPVRMHAVVLIHGIRTHADWAEMVRARLIAAGIDEVIPIRYGYFDAIRFLIPGSPRSGPLNKIKRELRDIRRRWHNDDISVIAHSFGTYAISKILNERDIYFHRVIFCGSIIPANFRRLDYQAQLGPDPIINDCGTSDIWPVLATAATWGYGATGTFGFGSNGIRDRYHPFHHGSFFTPDFVDQYWGSFLTSGKIEERTWEQSRPAPKWYFSILSTGVTRYLIIIGIGAALVTGIRLILGQQ